MKKPLILLLLFLCAGAAKAQNINLSELADLVKLNNEQVSNFLNAGRKFGLISSEKVKGLKIDTYRTDNIPGNETIIAGGGIILSNKNVLHKVDYNTTNVEYAYSLIRQMEKLDYKRVFNGSDVYKKIYLYDNGIYRVTIHINQDGKAANIEIKEKLLGVD